MSWLAAATLGGSVIDAWASKSSAKSQMDFQEKMSNTSHQREVKDLRKAGLNPILSANQGASSPGGAQWSSNIAGGVSSAVQVKRLLQETKNLTSAGDVLSKEAAKANQEQALRDQYPWIRTAEMLGDITPAAAAAATALHGIPKLSGPSSAKNVTTHPIGKRKPIRNKVGDKERLKARIKTKMKGKPITEQIRYYRQELKRLGLGE